MLQRFAMCLIAGIVVFTGSLTLMAQNVQWKVGDKIEIKNLSKDWVPGSIIGTDQWNGKLIYRVKLDDENAPNVYFNHTDPADIRARGGGQPPANQPGGGPPNNDPVLPNVGGPFKVGDTVDALFNPKEGNRGVITEVGDRRYKVSFRGCAPQFQNWFDAPQVSAPAAISAKAPEISYLFGKWRTTTVAVGGNFVAWGSSPGIQINPDGTYVWYAFAGRPPVKGRWTTDAKVPGVTIGTPKFDGVIVKDAESIDWKVFKWEIKDPQDHVEIDRMCLGMSEVGVRIR